MLRYLKRKGVGGAEGRKEGRRLIDYWEIYKPRVCCFPRLNMLQIQGKLLSSLSQILKTLNPIFPQIHIFQCF